MLCDKCNKNNATVHITKVINGHKEEVNLCESCAKQEQGIGITDNLDLMSSFSVQNILANILDYMNKPQEKNISYEITCPHCGTTYNEFKAKGLLGCSECYKVFNDSIIPIIKRIHGNVEHTGKIPEKSGQYIIKQRNLQQLRDKLQKCIKEEEYEKAAEIRDEIKLLENEKEEEA
ncbi:UvrB/UvrC motif-containing protein [Clostridium botulinum]|uniref:Excinuclease n=2 Tax=Clostridium botulinum TaxID=1491 RepID=A0A846HSS6_CLOBO|nr:UvrB/UvrC motif-containing protein [Clostridium botulinum]AJD26505.1 uvrB/uvrC motif family protein [Clostridium botulinum CDC_297]ACQ55174.1 UVR domain protein [Clostridium botulinum Ba4 str. 657]AJE12115.1 uvrB/uvrC motif family protein [Clostridium botulinum CDC_1436]APQ99015.1 uvrB/uvrC motif family protein [Clostridium botulinum]APU58767.1 uvrB/uvrC motif family protein [Clostridium botulinum]